jgi:hypothetical protein
MVQIDVNVLLKRRAAVVRMQSQHRSRKKKKKHRDCSSARLLAAWLLASRARAVSGRGWQGDIKQRSRLQKTR